MILGERVNFWPSLVDIMAATLTVVILSMFVQVLNNVENQETLSMELSKSVFIQDLERAFKESHDKGEIDWEWDPHKFLRITYSDKVLFQKCDYHLQETGTTLLSLQADILRQAIAKAHLGEVQVEGHTDRSNIKDSCAVKCPETGAACWHPANNWELSSARSISVVQFLMAHSDLDGSLFSANAYASYRPAKGKGPEDRTDDLDRRIEIKIFFTPVVETSAAAAK